MAQIDVLLAVQDQDAGRFYKGLPDHGNLMLTVTTNVTDAVAHLADKTQHTDVLVMDNNLSGKIFELITELRQQYTRLLIVLVDEQVDFAMPGQADDISTDPFRNDDLAKRITRLLSDRRMETLRSDSLPAVRQFVKQLRAATGMYGKQEVAVQACKDLKYDYVAYYHRADAEPLRLALRTQLGTNPVMASAPKESNADDLMGWVFQNAQSRIAAPPDKPNHPMVARGRLGAVACVPVMFNSVVYGVMTVCQERPDTITQENVLMVELICGQLAAAMSKEQGA
ncbi:MAG: GAF domain-containing protein [Armatimonadetes bacterium]|nr:GAF domain-containing protein [Anaerolineae bacterium]